MTTPKSPDWYVEYLDSEHWQTLRQQKLLAVDNRCEKCGAYPKRLPGGSLGGLDVHHLTYERLWNEPLDDLEVLCVRCHALEHGQPSDDRSLVRRRWESRGVERDDIDLEIEAWDNLSEEADLGVA